MSKHFRVHQAPGTGGPPRGRDGAGRIVVSGLTKTFGSVTAVDDLSFTVEPGAVTGFLGPNGAGKTTTLRMLLGLVSPDAGSATIGGLPYHRLPAPGDMVGAALEATGFHPARTGRDHLRVSCTVQGYPRERAEGVLTQVGLSATGDRKVGGYSLGMRQRLALAGALLGDPPVLVLDEPANGLDPEGISWMRRLLRGLADEGRTVLVSSHVLSEVQQLVDRVVILRQGRLVSQGTLAELSLGRHDRAVTHVASPHADRLAASLTTARGPGATVERTGPDTVLVTGLSAAAVGRLALEQRIELHQLTSGGTDLERVFLALTTDSHQESS